MVCRSSLDGRFLSFDWRWGDLGMEVQELAGRIGVQQSIVRDPWRCSNREHPWSDKPGRKPYPPSYRYQLLVGRVFGNRIIEFTAGGSGTLFDWLKRTPKPPSKREIAVRIASILDAFVEQEGTAEFSNDRLHLVVGPAYRVSIRAKTSISEDAVFSIPLNGLGLDREAVRSGGLLRHHAVDMAAMTVIRRLPLPD